MTGKWLAIEKVKMLHYRTFWVILALYTLMLVAGYYLSGSFGSLSVNNQQINLPELTVFAFPGLWHYLTYISGFLHYILALTVIALTANDLQYGLWRQHVAEGMDRSELIGAKVLVMMLLALYSTLLVILTGLAFGLSHTADADLALVLESAGFLIGYGVQAFAYMTLAFLFAVVVQRAGTAIILLLVYAVVGERLILFLLPEPLSFYLPMAAFSAIISNPFMTLFGIEVADSPFTTAFYISLAWIVMLLGAAYAFLRYNDV
ncbi:MAG: hypothetical protein WD266_04465 [Balneolales bacterium]